MLAVIAGSNGFTAPLIAEPRMPQNIQNQADFFQLQTNPSPPPMPQRNQLGGGNLGAPPPIQVAPPPQTFQAPEIVFQNQIPQGVNGFPPQGVVMGQPSMGDPFLTQPLPTQNNTFPTFPYSNQPGVVGSGVQPGFNQPAFGQPQSFQGTRSNWLPAIDWNQFQQEFLPRLFERPRVRHTYLYGDNEGRQLGIHDLELATTVTFANFLQTNQPLRLTPGFIFHFWNGPSTIDNPGFDLPPRAYSVFLTLDHLTNPANEFGLETNFTVGYYSDFKNSSSNGLRFTGRGLFWTRLNSYTVGKIGVEYFDRIDLKLLPAFGVYMQPNPDVKLDLMFPQTRLSHRLPNFNDTEGWAYIGAEIGGGSWVIERMGGLNDQVDINDIRAFIGLEWMGPRRVTGFIEGGYVFNRALLYRSDPANKLDLSDTFMIRSGFAF